MKHLWKSQFLDSNDKIPTGIQNKIILNNLLAGFLIRECTENYSLKLFDIPLNYLQLIISIEDDVGMNNGIWNNIIKWFRNKKRGE